MKVIKRNNKIRILKIRVCIFEIIRRLFHTGYKDTVLRLDNYKPYVQIKSSGTKPGTLPALKTGLHTEEANRYTTDDCICKIRNK